MQAQLARVASEKFTPRQLMRLASAERHARLAAVTDEAAEEFRMNPELTEFANPAG